jgi:cold shock CspA family protein
MRTHGTLTKWNDDRGFGFITPAKQDGDLFVHISAFPRDGTRPRLNELISFEIEAGPDGKRRAVRVMRPGRPRVERPARARPSRRRPASTLGGALMLAAVIGLGAYGYSQYTGRASAVESTAGSAPGQLTSPLSSYSCDGRTMCSEMTSCAEATYFIRNCPNTKMDGDGDGVPCESQWCN